MDKEIFKQKAKVWWDIFKTFMLSYFSDVHTSIEEVNIVIDVFVEKFNLPGSHERILLEKYKDE